MPSVFLEHYETSTDAVLSRLGVKFVEVKDFNCCGYPLKNSNFKAYLLSSARNLALAEKNDSNILTFCNDCYLSTKHVNQLMKEDAATGAEINKTLEKEGLKYEGNVEVRHLLDVLYHDVGVEQIKEKMTKTFDGLKLAVHYGCHILRPRQLVQFNDPGTAPIFDQLVDITGAERVAWSTQGECCASPIWGINDDLSLELTGKKLAEAKESGAEYLCVACPFCQLQFDRVQRLGLAKGNGDNRLPSLIFTQLLGLSLGVDQTALGIQKNELDASGIMNFLSQKPVSQPSE